MSAEVPARVAANSGKEGSSSDHQNLLLIDQGDPQRLIELPPTGDSAQAQQVSHGSKAELRERAKRLKRTRKKQKDIARELGVSQPTVSRLLNGTEEVIPVRNETAREFKVGATVDTVLLAIAHGGAISARKIPQRVFDRLARCEVLKKSAVPRYYVLSPGTLRKLATGRQSSFIRFCLFDVLQFDRLEANQFESKLVKIREIWKRRKSL